MLLGGVCREQVLTLRLASQLTVSPNASFSRMRARGRSLLAITCPRDPDPYGPRRRRVLLNCGRVKPERGGAS
jgi:hypothetical protein